MKRVLAGLMLTVIALTARAEDHDIEAVIGAQIEAFRAGDFDAAFSYASPTIRGIFRTSENFEAMVRGGYGVMLNPASIEYLERRDEAGGVWQRVLYRDIHGELYFYDYELVQVAGGWKIDAVIRVRMPKPSA